MQSTAGLDDCRWLFSAEAAKWLTDLAESDVPLHTSAQRLRRHTSANRAHLVLEQVELRRRARAKFSEAERMFFTRQGLEQATDQWLAAYKALRFPNDQHVAELCCGIGGDLLAIASGRSTSAVDHDLVVLAMAEQNVVVTLGTQRSSDVTYLDVDVTAGLPESFAVWHIDPDRRSRGERTSQLVASSPSLTDVERLLIANRNGAVKLAPAANVPISWSAEGELEWLGRDGECKQLVAWHGELAHSPGRRRATIVSQFAGDVCTFSGTADVPIPIAPQIDRYVFEPHATVLAARLEGELAAKHGLQAVSANCAYLTADQPLNDACLTRFEIVDVLPFDRRRLARYFSARGVGRLEIKKRGVEVDPRRLRSELHPRGDHAATLIVTPVAGAVKAIVARRCQR